jgi:hypothetical protein
MARKRALSAREVEALRDIGMHWVSDNLYLQIRDQGTRSWLFRYWVDSRPKVIGLGPVKDVTLAQSARQSRPTTRPKSLRHVSPTPKATRLLRLTLGRPSSIGGAS